LFSPSLARLCYPECMGKLGLRPWKRLLRWMVGGSLLLILAAALSLGILIAMTPSPRPLRNAFPSSTAFIDREKAAGQRVIWMPVAYDRISVSLKEAVLVSEDITFFQHHGFELHEIREALSGALHGKKLRGASTLTQQLAKNLWLSPERSLKRKIEEAVLTWKLERSLSKKRILELYLNCVEFGPGIFGAEAAALYYYHKPASELKPEEAAHLAAALPRPSQRHPGTRSRATEQAVERILWRMKRAGWLKNLL